MQVVFEVCAPNIEKDYFGIELYLKNYLNGTQYDTSELATLMLEEMDVSTFTSVIKIPQNSTDDDDSNKNKSDDGDAIMKDEEVNVAEWEWNDIYGVISLLDYSKHKVWSIGNLSHANF